MPNTTADLRPYRPDWSPGGRNPEQLRAAIVAHIEAVLATHCDLCTPESEHLVRRQLSHLIWSWTEVHGKWGTRHATAAAVAAHNTGEQLAINHEHVWTRKWLIDRVFAGEPPGPLLTEFGIACVVLKTEHELLNRLPSTVLGWDRYTQACVDVVDRTGSS